MDELRDECLPALAHVDGWPINLGTLESAVKRICDAAKQNSAFSVVTLNLDHLVKLRRDGAFRQAYAAARFITADGAPVARLASLQGATIERTTGADLVIPLAEAAARNSIPVYLFGSAPEVLGRAGRRLAERTDFALDVVGTAAPEQGFEPAGRDADAALDAIAASGARLCFVALGAPKQEIFAARAVERGIPCGFICIGAALDFIAGAQVRAPKAMQDSGLEWLWRLMTSPRRLAGRYARCALVLADLVLLAPLKGRGLPHRT